MATRTPFPTRPRLLLPVLAVLLVLIIAGGVFTRLFTDLLFFRSVGFSSVYETVLGTRLFLFLAFGLLMALAVGANLLIAYRLRPPFRPLSLEQQNLERYRVSIEPFHLLLLIGIPALLGVLAGLSAAGRWQTWLLWRNGSQFGVHDPQFNKDISYFTFTYPFQRFVLGFLFAIVIVSLLVAAFTHYLYGGIRLQTQGERVIAAAKAHLSVLLGLFVLLKAVAYWLDRYGLAFSPRGRVTGASFTDVHAVLPAKTILIGISLLCAVLFVYNIFQRGWILPALSFAILVVSAIVIGGAYPAAIQYLQVKPNEPTKEAPYIARGIAGTRAAYGIDGDNVQVQQYPASTDVTGAQVAADKGTLPNARILDPVVLPQTFDQLQRIRSYYGFPDTLDIDRYTVNNKKQDYVVSVRELDQTGLAAGQRNWINLHLNYTHGKGFVAAPANVKEANGRPVFAVQNLPVSGADGGPSPIPIGQDRIYFGEQSPQYSVVKTKQAEIDGPAPNDPNGTGQLTNNYDGTGGVSIGSTFRKVLFGLRFQEKNLVLSGALTPQSRILYERNPRDRVQKVAPWLTVDGDPYPTVVNGRIVWVLDGYTTSDGYPYSERQRLADITTDAITADSTNTNRVQQDRRQVNYIRNSVKATVDAYDGSVNLYQFGAKDPVLETWMKAFPGTVKPTSEIPPALVDHLRYPEDLFKVQRTLISRYHVSDTNVFYSGEDFWAVPREPGLGTQPSQPPFYLFIQMPGQSQPEFNLTTPLISQRSPKLAAFVAVSSDPSDYGKIRVLQLPQGVTINGPEQVQAQIEADPNVSQQLTLLRGGGSDVRSGNLLTLPVANGLIYVQPYYVQARSDTAYPLLQRVAVAYGEKVGFAPTIQEALTQIFGSGAGASAPPDQGTTPAPTPTSPPTGGTALTQQQLVLVQQAATAYDDGTKALATGDFAAYGEAQRRLKTALDQLRPPGSTPAPTTPSPTATKAPAASAATPAPAATTPAPAPSP
ncbi:MAG: uncharacterized protein QOJ32_3458 [Frankiaceae bacterium]|nr:uncharacterized protein [Frankiaceae bacterium]MDQ1650494.1 uncharacterized protein [Frankiaceae bacterium]